MARLTIHDVAERAGVSVGTVSNVLNRPDVVAEKTRERVEDAIAELGFVWNNTARQLRGIRNPSIALVVLDVSNPFFTEVARGVERAASDAEHLVVLVTSESSPERETRALRLLDQQRVAGILISPAAQRGSRYLAEIRRHGTRVVLLDRHRSRGDHCSVAINDTSGASQVAQHFLELGHTTIGLLNGPRDLKPCFERRDGFMKMLSENGIQLADGCDVEGPMTIEDGKRLASEMFASGHIPTALFCGNDLMAIGAEQAAIDHGLRIPEDIALVGYDDIRFAETSPVPLTSVRNPAFDLGFQAAELLIDEVVNGDAHRHRSVLLEPQLVPRASTIGRAQRSQKRVKAARS